MNQVLQLGEVLTNPDKYLVDGSLFLPSDEVVDEHTRCAVLEWDEAEDEKPRICKCSRQRLNEWVIDGCVV